LVIAFAGALLAAAPTWAGKADVLTVEARQTGAEQWTFVVTVQHDDRDPAHWADWWRVRTVEGTELAAGSCSTPTWMSSPSAGRESPLR
jgi:hypothetical protein